MFLKLTNKDPQFKKDGKKRVYQKIRKIALKNLKGSSIEESSKEVNERVEYGHLEMDCVVGKKDSAEVLLVLSKQKIREEITYKLSNKTQESVINTIDELKKGIEENLEKILKR